MSWRRSDEPSYPAWGGSNTKGATQLISKRVSGELIRGNFLRIHSGVDLTQNFIWICYDRAHYSANGQQLAGQCLAGRSQGAAQCLPRICAALSEGGNNKVMEKRLDSDSTERMIPPP